MASYRSNVFCFGLVTGQMPFMGSVTRQMYAVLAQLQDKCPLWAQLQVKCLLIGPVTGQMPFMGSFTGQMYAVLAQLQDKCPLWAQLQVKCLLYWPSYRTNALYGLSNMSNACCIGPVTGQMTFMGPVTHQMYAVLAQLPDKFPLWAQ